MSTVYLDGAFVPEAEASVSADDRGFLFADGVYEVTAFYEGVPFCLERHIERLQRSLAAVRIDCDTTGLADVHHRLVAENGLERAERSLVYLQITRGAAPRTHHFPAEPVAPTVYAFAKAWSRPDEEAWNRGFSAITLPDERWLRVDIKTICLLANVLAHQTARDAGVDDAILVRDGVAIEGTHQNLFGVFDGVLVTHPESNLILPGITRRAVLEIARAEGISVDERPIPVEELGAAEELFLTGTTAEVKPCVTVDGRSVGDGRVGEITRTLSDGFLARAGGAPEGAGTATR